MGEVKQKCQVPTPHEIVIQMLDHIGYTKNLYGKRVLENSCGTGNFLIEIVKRYIQDCIAHNYSLEEIKFGLSRDIHAFEKDRRIHKQCIDNLSKTALIVFQQALEVIQSLVPAIKNTKTITLIFLS